MKAGAVSAVDSCPACGGGVITAKLITGAVRWCCNSPGCFSTGATFPDPDPEVFAGNDPIASARWEALSRLEQRLSSEQSGSQVLPPLRGSTVCTVVAWAPQEQKP